MAEERQCCFCGRKGSRRFVTYNGTAYVCTAVRACRRRRGKPFSGRRFARAGS